jgi:hypothetical protein
MDRLKAGTGWLRNLGGLFASLMIPVEGTSKAFTNQPFLQTVGFIFQKSFTMQALFCLLEFGDYSLRS